MIKNNKTPLIIKHNRNYHHQISGKKELSISILGTKLCRSTIWMIILPDQISQFVNELNHLLYDIDVLFTYPLTFCIFSIYSESRGTNYYGQEEVHPKDLLPTLIPRKSFLTIYEFFIRPHLDYGTIIYDRCCNASFH